ncbi:hypothetical protein Sjap_000323 [Stephania japonica]|uniref:Uncharacterized protein n=1 Tax=Stephania japonica TaxID=461633 RepID=A0AAP0PQB1_9MAGN
MQLDEAIETIKIVKEKSRVIYRLIAQEVSMILFFIQQKVYASMEELHGGFEQLFVDMLNECLAQLPDAILKEINESSAEDLEEKLRKSLETSMFGGDTAPVEINGNCIAITDIIADVFLASRTGNDMPGSVAEGNVSANVSLAMEDEIIQIE